MVRRLEDLSAREFENLTYDLLRLTGFENLTWRTPGSDQGRDIEGTFFYTDATGQRGTQRWYVECKRYKNSIGWPRIWEKLSYSNVKHADFLLLSTNSNPSPQCETQIAEWNRTCRAPQIRVWRGYEIDHLVELHKTVSLKYGLREQTDPSSFDFGSLSVLLTKTVQASYTANYFGLDGNQALEAAAAISELLTLRIDQVTRYGQFFPGAQEKNDTLYPWVTINGNIAEFEMISLRAVCSYLRFAARWDEITLEVSKRVAALRATSRSENVTSNVWRALTTIEPWLLVNITLAESQDMISVVPANR